MSLKTSTDQHNSQRVGSIIKPVKAACYQMKLECSGSNRNYFTRGSLVSGAVWLLENDDWSELIRPCHVTSLLGEVGGTAIQGKVVLR